MARSVLVLFMIYVGVAGTSLDIGQFEDDLDLVGDNAAFYPLTADFGMGPLWIINGHNIRIVNFEIEGFTWQANEGGRLAEYRIVEPSVSFGYGYSPTRWFTANFDVAFGFGQQVYSLITPQIHGRMQNDYYSIRPKIGTLFKFSKSAGFNLFATYSAPIADGGSLYSGDFHGDTFDDVDVSRMIFGLEYVVHLRLGQIER